MPVIPSPDQSQNKSAALLFGLNYSNVPGSNLKGCINDVQGMASLLKSTFRIQDVKICDDESSYADTTLLGIVRNLNTLALRSWSENLTFVWIHYSGHGSSVKDASADELDGKDECLVPSDFRTSGMLRDDEISVLLRRFNPKTHVVFSVDACHSGTMGDLKYRWSSDRKANVESTMAVCRAPVLMLSGCRDNQMSSEESFAMPSGGMRAQGAMTTVLLKALKEDAAGCCGNVFVLTERLRSLLKAGGFSQYPELTSSYDVSKDPVFFSRK